MLFMLTTQARPGVSREQLVHHFTHQLHPASWDAIRKGIVSNVLFKGGTNPESSRC